MTVLPYPAEPIRFRTFPDSRLQGGSVFRFIASSCMTPNFPYVPLQARSIRGLDLLADYLWPSQPETLAPSVIRPAGLEENGTSVSEPNASAHNASSESVTSPVAEAIPAVGAGEVPAPPTEFMIFMGYFIYADVPVYFGDDKEAYRRLYRRNYNSPSFRKVYERLREFPAFFGALRLGLTGCFSNFPHVR